VPYAPRIWGLNGSEMPNTCWITPEGRREKAHGAVPLVEVGHSDDSDASSGRRFRKQLGSAEGSENFPSNESRSSEFARASAHGRVAQRFSREAGRPQLPLACCSPSGRIGSPRAADVSDISCTYFRYLMRESSFLSFVPFISSEITRADQACRLSNGPARNLGARRETEKHTQGERLGRLGRMTI
jgi:hypothetical protein